MPPVQPPSNLQIIPPNPVYRPTILPTNISKTPDIANTQPGNNFPVPQNHLRNVPIPNNPLIISSNVGMRSDELQQSLNNGTLQSLQQRFPDAKVSINNAGPGQNYVNLSGPVASVRTLSSELDRLRVDSDSQWFYLGEDGSFIPYSAQLNQLIEKSFSEAQEMFPIDINFTIFFGQNGIPHIQHSNNSYVQRIVRRGLEPIQKSFTSDDVIWY